MCFQFTHFLVMIERIYILCLIIIIKSDIWTITNCLGLGHETMVRAVCLFVFLWSRLLFKMAMLGQFLRVPQDFEIFDDRLFWPGLRDDVTALTLRISGISLKFGDLMHSNMKQIAIYNGHAQPILARSTALKFGGIDGHTQLMFTFFISRPAEGAVVLWTSCVWVWVLPIPYNIWLGIGITDKLLCRNVL